MRWVKLSVVTGVFVLLWLAAAGGRDANALSRGPFLERTGAPGEETCVGCHRTYPLNSGAGSVEILDLPERYTPATVYPIRVRVVDPVASQWGFEITAIDDEGAAAGSFQTDSPGVLAIGPSQRYGRFYAHPTLPGVYAGQRASAEWTLFWKAPASDIGPVTLYAAGNAANGDHTDFYDYIYTSSATVDGQTRNVRVRLLSLDGGERIGAGEPATIRWEATEGDLASPASFRVLLSTDGGESYPSVIADDLPASARSVVWSVPEALATERARIRVVTVDTAGDEHVDSSRSDLTVEPIGLDRRGGAPTLSQGTLLRTAAWADVDGDGRADAALARRGEGVLLAAQSGDGTFVDRTATSGLGGAVDARALAWADADRDGRPDLATAAPSAVSIYHNDGEGVFSLVGAPTSLPASADPRGLAWSDVDGDGRTDLLVAGSDGLVAIRNTETGFADATALWAVPPGASLAVAAAGQLVATGVPGGIRVLRFEGAAFDRAAELAAPGVRSLVWADLTGDGWLDVVAATDSGLRVFVSVGGEGARFEERTAALGLASVGGATVVAARDYDLDARTDLFVVAGGTARVLRNRGQAGFADVTARFEVDAGTVSGAWVDLDGSGTVDLATIAEMSVALLVNPRSSATSVALRPVLGSIDAPGAVVRVDLDGDGDFSTGLRAAIPLDPGATATFVAAPGLATARVRVDFADGAGREVALEVGAAPVLVERFEPPMVTGVSATAKKLVVNGVGLPAAGARVEVAGVALGRVKAPARFVSNGRSSRLVGRDAVLGALVGSRPVAVRVFDPATGVLTRPVLLE